MSASSLGLNEALGISFETRFIQYAQSKIQKLVNNTFKSDTHLPSAVNV